MEGHKRYRLTLQVRKVIGGWWITHPLLIHVMFEMFDYFIFHVLNIKKCVSCFRYRLRSLPGEWKLQSRAIETVPGPTRLCKARAAWEQLGSSLREELANESLT